jgi:hypothetical protein
MKSKSRLGKGVLTAALAVLFFTAFTAAVASADEATNVTSPILMMNSPGWNLLLINNCSFSYFLTSLLCRIF